MSLARRNELVRLAREYDALIVTDDVYDFLQWTVPGKVSQAANMDRAILPRMVDIDRELDGGAERKGADGFGNAASNGSFSKIVGPGVRTGWSEGTGKFAYGLSMTYVLQPPEASFCSTRTRC
jgi:DNA-binding transcriptional MocR family regulator